MTDRTGSLTREPVDWLYQPPDGGFDSSARSYRGYGTSQVPRTLRPARPLQLKLKPGDLVQLSNTDGATRVYLFSLNERGESDFAALGLNDNPQLTCPIETPGLATILDWFNANGGCLSSASASSNSIKNNTSTAPSSLPAVSLFDASTRAGECFAIRVQQAATLWLLLEPDTPNDADRLRHGGLGGTVTVQHQPADGSVCQLPEPFGAVREEFTVERGTAQSYEVRAGEIIQIIDVQGQQCSDFMAMNATALQQGVERAIDSTVTRSMIRGAYPSPGLFDKFYDQDMRPLLQLKQDTVGRHDTFAFACTARGYEERGFFGHLNCSDNISHAYQRFGITPRAAWPAINFFFNSWIDRNSNQLQSDEAWSRAGDYIALQAMEDLVAVSTACPDDVGPINGWNPTDIHVRIYKQKTPLQYAVAYRSEPGTEAILTEQSAFHDRTSKLTRDYRVAGSVWLPGTYEGTRSREEYQACRTAVTVQDLSSLRKFDILGPDAQKLLQSALTRDITTLSLNRGLYALLCDDTGAVIDDGTLFRLGEDAYRWCCGSDDSGLHLRDLAKAQHYNTWIKAIHQVLPNLAIQGPASRELISKIAFTQPTASGVESLKWFGSTIARLYDREGAPFQLTRTGYTGELGYEIFCHPDGALPIWDALMREGEALGITPMGLDALNMLRIEAGLMAAGAEFTQDVDAFEAGLGFAVDLNKAHFIGKAALERNQCAQRRCLRGLMFKGHEAPIHGDPVMLGRRQVGIITSATVSPALNCAIAMARLASEHATSGTELQVGKLEHQAKRLHASVCDIPFVDPKRARVRA